MSMARYKRKALQEPIRDISPTKLIKISSTVGVGAEKNPPKNSSMIHFQVMVLRAFVVRNRLGMHVTLGASQLLSRPRFCVS